MVTLKKKNLNRSPLEKLTSECVDVERGVRHGDPLSAIC